MGGQVKIFVGSRSLRCRFADSYMVDSVDDLRVRRFKSVTTVMSLTQPETISVQDDLLTNQAVFHDITRASLHEKGHAIQVISPEAAFVAGVRRLAADLPA